MDTNEVLHAIERAAAKITASIDASTAATRELVKAVHALVEVEEKKDTRSLRGEGR